MLRSTLSLSCGALAALVIASVAHAGVPDPTRSGCSFPIALPCPDPVTVTVTLRDAFDTPVAACSTELTLVVDSGSLEPGQATTTSGVSDAGGVVVLTFADGILGNGTIHFTVQATCVGNILICTSATYPLACATVAVEPGSWGRVKSAYR